MEVRLDYIDQGIQGVLAKIDSIFGPINNRLDTIDKRADDHSKVIGDLSRESESKRTRRDNIKKIIVGGLVAGSGIAGKELFVWIWHLLRS